MRFHSEHLFDAPGAAVTRLLGDPVFYLTLELPDLRQPEILDHHRDEDELVIRLRYEFAGRLDPLAQRFLGSSRLTWIQEIRLDHSAGSGTLDFAAEKDPRRLHGTAGFTLTEEGRGTVRSLDGELIVALPGIGRMAERRIVPGLIHRLDIEAQALNDQLRRHGNPA